MDKPSYEAIKKSVLETLNSFGYTEAAKEAAAVFTVGENAYNDEEAKINKVKDDEFAKKNESMNQRNFVERANKNRII